MSEKNSERNDKKNLQNSLDKLYEIFQDISYHADELSKHRCPYKNAMSKCTANFYCQNQKYVKRKMMPLFVQDQINWIIDLHGRLMNQ